MGGRFNVGLGRHDTNPYWDKIFGVWFKNIILVILLIIGGVVVTFGLSKGWIDKEFGSNLIFLILGLIMGKWLENGKK